MHYQLCDAMPSHPVIVRTPKGPKDVLGAIVKEPRALGIMQLIMTLRLLAAAANDCPVAGLAGCGAPMAAVLSGEPNYHAKRTRGINGLGSGGAADSLGLLRGQKVALVPMLAGALGGAPATVHPHPTGFVTPTSAGTFHAPPNELMALQLGGLFASAQGGLLFSVQQGWLSGPLRQAAHAVASVAPSALLRPAVWHLRRYVPALRLVHLPAVFSHLVEVLDWPLDKLTAFIARFQRELAAEKAEARRVREGIRQLEELLAARTASMAAAAAASNSSGSSGSCAGSGAGGASAASPAGRQKEEDEGLAAAVAAVEAAGQHYSQWAVANPEGSLMKDNIRKRSVEQRAEDNATLAGLLAAGGRGGRGNKHW